jgi:hypothetical protein
LSALLVLVGGAAGAQPTGSPIGFSWLGLTSDEQLQLPQLHALDSTGVMFSAILEDPPRGPKYCRVQYGTTPSDWQFSTPGTLDTVDDGLFSATLTGLSENTKYYYRLLCRSQFQRDFASAGNNHFTTPPDPGETDNFAFGVYADSHYIAPWANDTDGVCGTVASKTWQRFTQSVANMMSHTDILGVFSVGDEQMLVSAPPNDCDVGAISTGDGDCDTQDECDARWRQWMNDTASLHRTKPLAGFATGNHDGTGQFYLQGATSSENLHTVARGLLSTQAQLNSLPNANDRWTNGEDDNGNFYSFEWGDACFIVLDNMTYTGWDHDSLAGTDPIAPLIPGHWTLGAEQLAWFQAEATACSRTWLFVFAHHLLGGAAQGGYAYGRGFTNTTTDASKRFTCSDGTTDCETDADCGAGAPAGYCVNGRTMCAAIADTPPFAGGTNGDCYDDDDNTCLAAEDEGCLDGYCSGPGTPFEFCNVTGDCTTGTCITSGAERFTDVAGTWNLDFVGEQHTLQTSMEGFGGAAAFWIQGHDHLFAAGQKTDTVGGAADVYYITAGRAGQSRSTWSDDPVFKLIYDSDGDGKAEYCVSDRDCPSGDQDADGIGSREFGFVKVNVTGATEVKACYYMTKTATDDEHADDPNLALQNTFPNSEAQSCLTVTNP